MASQTLFNIEGISRTTPTIFESILVSFSLDYVSRFSTSSITAGGGYHKPFLPVHGTGVLKSFGSLKVQAFIQKSPGNHREELTFVMSISSTVPMIAE